VNISELNESEVLIYPNPVKDNFIIEVLSNDNSELFAFKLIDARGRVLREESFKNQIQIDRHDLAAGVYVIHLNTSTQFLQQKIIISEK
ncbi:T9SS type A sorting domain-containing protein, partial [Flavobacteriales bacterium]|nr:T9SS type A sorting domain-containing protein [Flavobacteriales bacterium]